MQCIDVSMFDVTIKVFSAALNFHGLPNDFDNADVFGYVKPWPTGENDTLLDNDMR